MTTPPPTTVVAAVLGVVLLLGAATLSSISCTRSARAAGRPTDVQTLSGLLGATVIGCGGASLVATATGPVLTVLAFAVGAVGVALPVVLGLAAGSRADRHDLS